MKPAGKEHDIFGLSVFFSELASNDPAVNQGVINAVNIGTASVGATAGVSGGASIFSQRGR